MPFLIGKIRPLLVVISRPCRRERTRRRWVLEGRHNDGGDGRHRNDHRDGAAAGAAECVPSSSHPSSLFPNSRCSSFKNDRADSPRSKDTGRRMRDGCRRLLQKPSTASAHRCDGMLKLDVARWAHCRFFLLCFHSDRTRGGVSTTWNHRLLFSGWIPDSYMLVLSFTVSTIMVYDILNIVNVDRCT